MAARQRLNRERRYSLSEKATGVSTQKLSDFESAGLIIRCGQVLRDVEKKVEHALTCMWDDLRMPWPHLTLPGFVARSN